MGTCERWFAAQCSDVFNVIDAIPHRETQELTVRSYLLESTGALGNNVFSKLLQGLQSAELRYLYLFRSASDWISVLTGIQGDLEPGDASNLLLRLSSKFETLDCFADEHQMVSRASCFFEKKLVWSVSHDEGEGSDHLSSSGALPSCFKSVLKREIAIGSESLPEPSNQVKTGKTLPSPYKKFKRKPKLFEVPPEVSYQVSGYKYSMSIPETVKLYKLELLRD